MPWTPISHPAGHQSSHLVGDVAAPYDARPAPRGRAVVGPSRVPLDRNHEKRRALRGVDATVAVSSIPEVLREAQLNERQPRAAAQFVSRSRDRQPPTPTLTSEPRQARYRKPEHRMVPPVPSESKGDPRRGSGTRSTDSRPARAGSPPVASRPTGSGPAAGRCASRAWGCPRVRRRLTRRPAGCAPPGTGRSRLAPPAPCPVRTTRAADFPGMILPRQADPRLPGNVTMPPVDRHPSRAVRRGRRSSSADVISDAGLPRRLPPLPRQ